VQFNKSGVTIVLLWQLIQRGCTMFGIVLLILINYSLVMSFKNRDSPLTKAPNMHFVQLAGQEMQLKLSKDRVN